LACHTITPTSGSSAARRHASSSSSSNSIVWALAASGRLSVIVAIRSLASYSMKDISPPGQLATRARPGLPTTV